MLVSKKKYGKLQSECDFYRATAEAREREVYHWKDGHHKLAKRLIATEGTLKDAELARDAYKAEGARLADELAEMRKAPEIKGVRVRIKGDAPFDIEGAMGVEVMESDSYGMLIQVLARHGDRSRVMAVYANVTSWEFIPAETVEGGLSHFAACNVPMNEPAPKKEAVATKKAGRKR